MKKSLLAITAMTLLFTACKKDDETPVNPKKTVVTSGKWHITSSSSVVAYPAPIGTQTFDLFAMIPACQRDNRYTFNSDNTVTTDEGATKCNASDPQQKTGGTWAFLNNDTQFQVVDGSNSVSGDILVLDNSTLTLRYTTTANGIQSTTTTSYSHEN